MWVPLTNSEHSGLALTIRGYGVNIRAPQSAESGLVGTVVGVELGVSFVLVYSKSGAHH